MSHHIDIVLCVQGSASMWPVIEELKANAKSFHADFRKAMDDIYMPFTSLRLKTIIIGDLKCGIKMESTPFLKLPDEIDDYAAFINTLLLPVMEDEPVSSLEALIAAMKSDWLHVEPSERSRQIIVLVTDRAAYTDELGHFSQSWSEMDYNKKRMIIFAPQVEPWISIAENLDNIVMYFVKGGCGLEEVVGNENIPSIIPGLIARGV